MKKYLILVFFIIIAAVSTNNSLANRMNTPSSSQSVTIVTHNVLPPYAFKDENGNLTGIYIEIVKAVASKMPHYSVQFKVLPWARAKYMVKTGKAFAILPPYYHAHDWLTDTEPKRPYIWPYSKPLFTQTDVVICNNKVLKNRSIKKYPNDLKGLNVVMYRGSGRAGTKFLKMVEKREVNLNLIQDNKSAIWSLLSERADCIIISRATFAWYIKEMKKSGEYYEYKKPSATFKEILIIGKNKGYLGYCDIHDEKNYPYKNDFSKKFDIEFTKLKRKGEIQKIVNRFIK